MQRWYDFIADYNGKPLAGATVQVQNYPALTNATYYLTTDTSAPLTVPLTSGADGGIAFYAADGRYQLTITATNGRITIIPDILIEDPAEGTVPIALSASTATWAIGAGTSSYAGTAGNSGTASFAGTASFVSGAVAIASTATYAISAGTATANASLNGSATEVFSVAAATAAAHALRAGQYGSQINGWTYANNGADATNDLDIAAGSGLDSTRAYFITGAALTKQSDVAWAVGTNAGMLDTGAVGDSDYYIWAIARSDTGVVDYLSSLSSTAPTMPASYDYKRLIGWFKRVGGAIVAFHTYETEGGGLEFAWDVPTSDFSLTNTLTTARRTDTIRVPTGFSVIAELNVQLVDASAEFSAQIWCPDVTDVASALSVLTSTFRVQAGANGVILPARVRTSATGTIAARASLATVDVYSVATMSFTWARRT